MPENSVFDDIARRLSGAIPASAQSVQDDLEKNLRAAAQAAFTRLDLVTREEFEVQRKVLARSRAKIESLEKQVAELEAKLLKQGKA
jgi:BMFP domain-containing protein YqiC